VSEETKTASGTTSTKGRFPPGFDQAFYWVSAAPDAFDIGKFRSRLPKAVSGLDEAAAVIFPRNAERGSYHVVFSWSITTAKVRLNIRYHSGALPPDDGEPYIDVDSDAPDAEDFMGWLGQFFRASTVKFHVHALFDYPLKTRRNAFPFRLTTKRLPVGAALYGIALKLKTAPHGASSVRITKGIKRWYAVVVSDRRVSFANFSPYVDAAEAMTVVGMFLGER